MSDPQPPRLKGLRAAIASRSRVGPLGLRTVAILGALLVVVAAGLSWNRASPTGLAPLTAEDADKYLSVALDVRNGRRAARRSGWHVSTWADWPPVAEALERVGWTMETYMRVEGQLAAARLRIEDPDLFGREYSDAAAPHAHVEIARARLAPLQAVQSPLPP